MFVCVHFLKGFLKAVEEREGEEERRYNNNLRRLTTSIH